MCQKTKAITALTTMLLLAVACNRETIVSGLKEDGESGDAFLVSALMPTCGCISFTNLNEKPSTDIDADSQEASGQIEIVAMLHGTEVGSFVLEPGGEHREKFDWAGSENSDQYRITAYRWTGVRGAQLKPIVDSVIDQSVSVTTEALGIPCRESTCVFGSLGLGNAWNSEAGQEYANSIRGGVNFTNSNRTLSVRSESQTCGCMLLRNVSKPPRIVHLQSTQNGRDVGYLDLEPDGEAAVGFDWGGDSDYDGYSITGALGPAVEDNPGMQPTSPDDPLPYVPTTSREFDPRTAASSPKQIRISDYVVVVGRLDNMECNGDGASDSVANVEVICPFNGLEMDVAYKASKPSEN